MRTLLLRWLELCRSTVPNLRMQAEEKEKEIAQAEEDHLAELDRIEILKMRRPRRSLRIRSDQGVRLKPLID